MSSVTLKGTEGDYIIYLHFDLTEKEINEIKKLIEQKELTLEGFCTGEYTYLFPHYARLSDAALALLI